MVGAHPTRQFVKRGTKPASICETNGFQQLPARRFRRIKCVRSPNQLVAQLQAALEMLAASSLLQTIHATRHLITLHLSPIKAVAGRSLIPVIA